MTESAVKHGIDGEGTGGLTGFCMWLLKNDLKAWCHIFGRLVPLQVAAEVGHHGGGATQVTIVNIPRGVHFSKEQAAAIANQSASVEDISNFVIEATANKEKEGADAQLADAELVEASSDEGARSVVSDLPPDDANVVVIRPAPPFARRRDWPGPRD